MTEAPFATAQELGSRSSDPDAAIRQASALVRGMVGWHVFPQRAETFVVDAAGLSTVVLPTLHLVSVSAVRDDERVVTGVVWTPSGIVRRDAGRFAGVVQVDAVHGHQGPPADLADVVMALAERIMQDATLSHGSERLGDYSVAYGDLSTFHRATLARYTVGGAA